MNITYKVKAFGFTQAVSYLEKNREKYNCNIPWAILLDPTSACNLQCKGCWAAEYGHKLNLSYEDIDSIIEQGKALGIYLYIYTDDNWNDVSSEAFYDKIIDMGALFVWFFHYMPLGKSAVPELMVTPEQRLELCGRIRGFRKTKPIFVMDFQNDAQHVGGCIAGGRRYLHINAAGDVDPCVFIHYSNVNIHDCTLLEALRSPIFMDYHDGQPFNDNMLRPCPMLENPELLSEMVRKTGANSTDPQAPESAEELCARTAEYAKRWPPVAEQLWHDYTCCTGCSQCPNAEGSV